MPQPFYIQGLDPDSFGQVLYKFNSSTFPGAWVGARTLGPGPRPFVRHSQPLQHVEGVRLNLGFPRLRFRLLPGLNSSSDGHHSEAGP